MRCFLAVSLPADQAAALARLSPPVGRAVPPENMHITLAFLGEQDLATLEEIDRAMETVHVPVGEIRITGLTTFGREPHALVAEVAPEAGLSQLRSSILGRLHGAGVQPDRQRFRPHVTLARFRAPLGFDEAERLARFIERRSRLALSPFLVDAFVLYQSTLHRDGARYDELARYPLPAAGS